MKQILQSLSSGSTSVSNVPVPHLPPGGLLIGTRHSLVSAGTERMLVEFGRSGWLARARQQPDKVRMVLEKARTDGMAATFEAVQSKLDQPLPLGYSNVGVVQAVGQDATGFAVGDRVVSNGPHAEVVTVPSTLCARIPDSVSDEQASFTVLGAIGLQGIRLAAPTLGECVVVTGLGLIGLLTVQLLRAQGCRVMGIDPDAERRALAQSFGAELAVNPIDGDVSGGAERFSRGRGVDAVLITASTRSNEPVSQAAHISRKRGRIVLVGVTGLELSRADFYEKELSFQVSCSYGPGRYDPNYEEKGNDYPVGFVRWTEQRNFEAVLDMMAAGAIDVAPLISHRFDLDQAEQAYEVLASGESSLGIVLRYPGFDENADDDGRADRVVIANGATDNPPAGTGRVAFIGAGNYAGRVLIPAFKAAGADLQLIVSGGGVSAAHYGRKFGFAEAGTDWRSAISDSALDTAVIATRHDAHARQVIAALEAGKNVFCEKPLCLTLDELAEIENALDKARQADPEAETRSPILMVGFNRRFSPHVLKMKALLSSVNEPKAFVMTVNAGMIPSDHWTQDPAVGGGRIIGEACHFIDLLRHLADSPIEGADIVTLGPSPGMAIRDDKATIVLRFEDGSTGTIHYLANGHKSFPKERLEVFCAGRVLQLDNFRRLRGWGWSGFSRMNLWRQDKGQINCVKAFMRSVAGKSTPAIPIGEILEVSRVSIELADRSRHSS